MANHAAVSVLMEREGAMLRAEQVVHDLIGWARSLPSEVAAEEGTDRTEGDPKPPADLIGRIACALSQTNPSGPSAPAGRPYPYSRFSQEISAWEAEASRNMTARGTVVVRKRRWPHGTRFAIALTHDVDQIWDRELFRWLGDINHMRRHLLCGERGDIRKAFRRVARPFFGPRNPFEQFRAIRNIESANRWRSSFFLLEDRYWARRGGRFRWDDVRFRRIADYLLAEGCELGIHGSAYSHADPDWWQRKADRFEEIFGHRAVGARNHYLSLRAPASWEAQASAGLSYDSTFGSNDEVGAPHGMHFPFFPTGAESSIGNRILELPLTVMDQALFRGKGLAGEDGTRAAIEALRNVEATSGLGVALWHNNFFSEAEYGDWQTSYEALLEWIGGCPAWVAPGRDIDRWWRDRKAVDVELHAESKGGWTCRVRAGVSVAGLVLDILGAESVESVSDSVAVGRIDGRSGEWEVRLGEISAGGECHFRIKGRTETTRGSEK